MKLRKRDTELFGCLETNCPQVEMLSNGKKWKMVKTMLEIWNDYSPRFKPWAMNEIRKPNRFNGLFESTLKSNRVEGRQHKTKIARGLNCLL